MNFVISLPSANDRRLHIAEEFTKKSVDYTLFDAIQPHQIHLLEEKYNIYLIDSGLTSGEKACFFSHVEIWNMMVEQKIPYVAIFEDDVFLSQKAYYFLQDFNWVPKDIHIIKLEMFEKYVLMSFNKVKLKKGQVLRKLEEKHLGTAGYILSLEGAKMYLDYIKNKGVNEPLDRLMFESFLRDGQSSVYQMVTGLSAQADRIGNESLVSQLEFDRKNNRLNQKNHKYKLSLMQKLNRELVRLVYQIKKRFCKVGFY